jgi:hypothetical protein
MVEVKNYSNIKPSTKVLIQQLMLKIQCPKKNLPPLSSHVAVRPLHSLKKIITDGLFSHKVVRPVVSLKKSMTACCLCSRGNTL